MAQLDQSHQYAGLELTLLHVPAMKQCLYLEQVKDYPGLLRVIAWVINGVDLTVENAKCDLSPLDAHWDLCSSRAVMVDDLELQ